MHYRMLGRTGLRVSEIGVGGAQFGIPDYMGKWNPYTEDAQQQTTATIHRALELGYNYFDTAPGYGQGRSEEMVGHALKGRREEVVIATKISAGLWGDPSAIRQSVEASLCRLQTDVLDLIQLHGGWYNRGEDSVVLERGGLETLQRLRDEGKVRFLGFTCEGPSGGVERLIASGAFDAMQVRYNLMYQHPSDYENNEGIIRQADAQGMGVILMRPLTSGVFQRLMAAAFPEIPTLEVGRLLLNYVLSDRYVDVALIGMREPRLVDINNAISDDVAARLDLNELHYRFAR
ncbi:MAG: aldo/keto reductase [Chloroflexi bacterium]|nr:aldo/keto reductase [Chloroflexota bacterium]